MAESGIDCEQLLQQIDANVNSMKNDMIKKDEFNQNMDDLATVLSEQTTDVSSIKEYIEKINNMLGLPNKS